MIPNHMKVNKTSDVPPKVLIDAVLVKSLPLLVEGYCNFDHCHIDGLFVAVTWRGFPFAKLLKKWYCITVSDTGREPKEDYLLVQYHDFTRIYRPGSWEEVFREKGGKTNGY